MQLDDHLKNLLRELGHAINDTVSESDRITGAIAGVRAHGYDIVLKLDATIGLAFSRVSADSGGPGVVLRRIRQEASIASDHDTPGCAIFEVFADCNGRYRMKYLWHPSILTGLFLALLTGIASAPASAQAPVPIIITDIAAPIVISAVKPKPSGLAKFEGRVMNANIAEITLRSKTNETAIQTITLSKEDAVKMQQVVDKGGYQYGDRETFYYDPATRQAVKFKGKPSKPI